MLSKISCLRRKILQCTSTPPQWGEGEESSPICVKQLELSRGGACEYVSLSTALQNAPRPSPTPKQKKASALNSFSPLTSLACQKVFGQRKQKQTKPTLYWTKLGIQKMMSVMVWQWWGSFRGEESSFTLFLNRAPSSLAPNPIYSSQSRRYNLFQNQTQYNVCKTKSHPVQITRNFFLKYNLHMSSMFTKHKY